MQLKFWRQALGTWLLLVLLLGVSLGASPPAAAIETRSGDTVSIPAGTTLNDDLIAAAQTITIAGDVTGDVYAFGSTITVTGTIGGDLIAAGQQITIDGTVRGDVRAAGQQVTINGRVDGSATTAGQQVVVSRQGTVGGSLLVGSQDANVVGSVGRGVLAGAAALSLNGSVGGDVRAYVERLSVDPAARIGGRLEYTSENQTNVPTGVAAGGVTYQQPERTERQREERRDSPFSGMFSFFNLVWLVGSIIAGILLVHFFPTFANDTAEQMRRNLLPSLGIGALALIATPIAMIVVAVTLIGLPLSFLTFLAYMAALFVGQLLLGLAVGVGLVELVRRWRSDTPRFGAEALVVLGLVVVYILSHLPWIGGLITFVALCLGLGALLRQLVINWQSRRAAPLAPAA